LATVCDFNLQSKKWLIRAPHGGMLISSHAPDRFVALVRGIKEMRPKKRLLTGVVVLAGFLSASTAFANVITPGQSGIAPDIFNGTLGSLASIVTSTGSGNLSNGATYTDYVIKGNVYGANDLSYVFVINPGSSGAIINSL